MATHLTLSGGFCEGERGSHHPTNSLKRAYIRLKIKVPDSMSYHYRWKWVAIAWICPRCHRYYWRTSSESADLISAELQ